MDAAEHAIDAGSAPCPTLPKSVGDLSERATEHGLEPKVPVLKNARQAQNAPSVFKLMWNGKLLRKCLISYSAEAIDHRPVLFVPARRAILNECPTAARRRDP